MNNNNCSGFVILGIFFIGILFGIIVHAYIAIPITTDRISFCYTKCRSNKGLKHIAALQVLTCTCNNGVTVQEPEEW
jgi:hypothetical protein